MEFNEEEVEIKFEPTECLMDEVPHESHECLIPEKSRERYESQFRLFNKWRKEKDVKGVNEDLIMRYICEKSLNYKPSSLWAFTSMLKSTLLVHENVDIGKFKRVTSFLKNQSIGYKPKKSANLCKEEIEKFLREAPDDKYLLIKVATIFGISGACRREELYKLQVDNIEDRGEVLVVNVLDLKTNQPRKFTIIGDGDGYNPLELYRRYASLRPPHVDHNRFFTTYHNGKCSVQPVGIKSFGKFPSMVASFLGLENPECYTGHCYRRSSSEVLRLRRLGSYASTSVPESFVHRQSVETTQSVEGAAGPSGNGSLSSDSDAQTVNEETCFSGGTFLPPGSVFHFNADSKCIINFHTCNHNKFD